MDLNIPVKFFIIQCKSKLPFQLSDTGDLKTIDGECGGKKDTYEAASL